MRIDTLLHNTSRPFFSLEFFPPSDPSQLHSFYETADELGKRKPLFVSVTYGAGGKKQHNTLAVTGELSRRGLNVMAHLTCVGASAESIRAFIKDLENQGVQNILALRGDPPAGQAWDWSKGEFRYAQDLVAFIKREFPHIGIGVAAYPAPHPESPSFEEDRFRTAQKLATGADFAITQLFFDSREYTSLVSGLRRNGISTPVIPGILPVQSVESLKRVISLCGANIPGKLFLELEEAQNRGGIEAVHETGIKFALEQIRRLLDAGAPGIHLYTLNKSALCTRIIEESGIA